MITISTNQIQAQNPCLTGFEKLLRHLGKRWPDDEQFPVSVGLDSNGLQSTLWVLRCLPEYEALWRLFAIWCVKQVEYQITDGRSKKALVVAEQFALGKAARPELAAASLAASDAWAAASAAAEAASSAAASDAASDAQSNQLRSLLDTEIIEIDGWQYYITA